MCTCIVFNLKQTMCSMFCWTVDLKILLHPIIIESEATPVTFAKICIMYHVSDIEKDGHVRIDFNNYEKFSHTA